MKRIALIMGLALTGAFGLAAQSPVQYNATDSVSAAMATIVADVLDATFHQQYPDQPQALPNYIEALEKSFSLTPEELDYYRNLAQGIKLRDDLEFLRKDGYPIDDERFLIFLKASLAGRPTGFTVVEADDYLSGYGNKESTPSETE